MTPSSHPSHSNPRLRLLSHTPGPNRAQESNDIDLTPVAGPSSAISSETPAARLRALLAYPSSSPSGRYPLTRPGRNDSSMSETDGNTVVDRARLRCKSKRKSFGDDDSKPISPSLSSLLRKSGSPIQIRALVSTSAASSQSVPDFPIESSKSEGKVRQTMSPSSTPHGTTPLISPAPQDGPEVETHKVDVTPRFPGVWTITPISLKHAPRATLLPPASPSTLTASSAWMPLSRANSEPKRRLMHETPAGNDLSMTIYPQSHAKSLHVRTPAPPGAWMSTTTLNLSNKQSKFGSIREKKHSKKVRFDVTESEASTAEVERKVPLVTDMRMRMPAPDSLPNGCVSRLENVPRTRKNGFSQADAVNDLVDRPLTPGSHMTPVSRAGAPSSRPLRKAFSVKFVDAFGRERSDEIPTPIPNGHAGAGDALPSTGARTPRISSKNKIRVINATGREVQEDVPERSSVLYDDPSSCHTAALAQIRRTLRTWAGGLSDEDRPLDNLVLNSSDSKELEERSSAARRPRHQLARSLRIESVKEYCERDLMHKYTKGAEDRSELLPIITGDNGFSQRDLVWVGVLLQIVFILAMWQFAHVQARHLFCAVYYEPRYPDLNSRISRRTWERWTERPDAESWPPT